MLSFEHKLSIFRLFDELNEVPLSNGRVNFVYRASRKRANVVVRELVSTGNGYVCVSYILGHSADARGWVNIKTFDEAALRDIVQQANSSMSRV